MYITLIKTFTNIHKGKNYHTVEQTKETPHHLALDIAFFFFFWLIDWLLCWVFISVQGLSLVAASGGHSSSRCAGLSLSRPLLLRSTGSRRAGSVVVAHRPNCSVACGIFPDQGSNPCPLHWQADSQPLRHQGSPGHYLLIEKENESVWLTTLSKLVIKWDDGDKGILTKIYEASKM